MIPVSVTNSELDARFCVPNWWILTIKICIRLIGICIRLIGICIRLIGRGYFQFMQQCWFVRWKLIGTTNNSYNSASLSGAKSLNYFQFMQQCRFVRWKLIGTITNSNNNASLSGAKSLALLPNHITVLVCQVKNHWHYYQFI